MPRQWDDNTGRSLQRCPSIPFLGKCHGMRLPCNLSAIGQGPTFFPAESMLTAVFYLQDFYSYALHSLVRGAPAYKTCPSPFGVLAMGDKGGRSRAGQEFGTAEIPSKTWCGVWFSKNTAITKSFRTKYLKVYKPAMHQKCFFPKSSRYLIMLL